MVWQPPSISNKHSTQDACSSNMLLPKCTVCLVQICSHNILGQMQLDDVWFCLLRHATKGADSPDDSRLHYDDFCQAMHPFPVQTHTHTHHYTCAQPPHECSFWLVHSLFTAFTSPVNGAPVSLPLSLLRYLFSTATGKVLCMHPH